MSLVKKITNLTKSFNNNQDGSVLLVTALLVPAIFLSAGVALDYTRMVSTKSKMDNALDAAILYAGNNLSLGMSVNDKFRKQFEDAFKANFFGRTGLSVDYTIASFEADEKTGKISARVESNIEATFTKLAGYKKLNIESNSTAVFAKTNTEIVMMLDITGSMKGKKITALKTAAKAAVDKLLSEKYTRTTRVGLVPYGSSVNVGNYAKTVTFGNRIKDVTGLGGFVDVDLNVQTKDCVTERGGANDATDVYYRNAPIGSDKRTVVTAGWRHCPDVEIMPLTKKRNQLKRRIDQMQASGATAGHIGVAWAYYMLSDKWKKLWPTKSDPEAYSTKVKKIAIIMTDGEFNTFYNGVDQPFGPHQAKSSNLARKLCTDMKSLKDGNPGITIFSVAFQAPKDAKQLLRDCASEDTSSQTHYYAAENSKQLIAAFEEIADSSHSLRLTR